MGAESRVVIGRGYTESRGFQWFTKKPLGSLVDPQSQGKTRGSSTGLVRLVGLTGLTGGSDQSDQCAMTQSGYFEAEDTRRDRMVRVEAMPGAVAGHMVRRQ
jgi:hypothetical protein